MPDLNSLPPSRSPSSGAPTSSSTAPQNPAESSVASPSPRSASVSALAQAATINAGMQHRQTGSPDSHQATADSRSPQLLHRSTRGSIGGTGTGARTPTAVNLGLVDPTLPGPGELLQGGSTGGERRGSLAGQQASLGSRRGSQHSAYRHSPSATNSPRSPGAGIGIMGDPHHQRAPSLGELHQELEQEQEAQVNRLLQMIRQQQAQLNHYQTLHPNHPPEPETAVHTPPVAAALSSAFPRTRSPNPRERLSRQSSYRSHRSSERGSPAVAAAAGIGGVPPLPPGALVGLDESGSRDEVAFYQAEAQNLTRENQILKVRIRELERQLGEAQSQTRVQSETGGTGAPAVTRDEAGDAESKDDGLPSAAGEGAA